MSFRAKVFSKTFTGGDTVKFPSGKYFRLITTSSAVNMTFYGSSGEVLAVIENLQAGLAIDAADFGVVGFGSVDITSASAQTVVAVISNMPVQYDRLTGSIAVTTTPPATLDSLADDSVATVATELIAAADTDRHELIISNLAANTATFRIGDSGAGAANGVPLAPGETLILGTSAAVYAYNPAAGAQSLSIVAVKT